MSSSWVDWFPPTDQKLTMTSDPDRWRGDGPSMLGLASHVAEPAPIKRVAKLSLLHRRGLNGTSPQ